MFDKLKMMGTLASLMKNKDQLKSAGDRIKAAAAATRATGEGGGGAVRVTVDGRMRVVEVDLQPALVMGMAADERTRQLAGTLIAEATNAALASAQVKMKVVLDKEAKELGLPEMPELGGLLS
jgi:nucleoid-associated protein EbfC